MKPRDLIIGIPAGLLVLAVILLVVETTSAVPHYELEPAVVRLVEPDAPGLGGYVGCRERTWVRFADGWSRHYGGNLGAPGERISVYRQRGKDTVFGIFSTRD